MKFAMLDSPIADFNSINNFFYDELNNLRKLKVREFDLSNLLIANFFFLEEWRFLLKIHK